MDQPRQIHQKRLGRGLSSLISSTRFDTATTDAVTAESPHSNAGLRNIPLRLVSPNPLQPRKNFDEARLAALANSLKRSGVLQPIVVRQKDDHYELVAGERRLRAAQMAGLESLPAIIRTADDATMLELALVENLQREDLNAVDRAKAYLEMATRFGLNHDEIGAKVGEDRTTVANYIRLLDLANEILDMVADGRLSMGHARSLLAVGNPHTRISLAEQAVRDGWSVRTMEERVRGGGQNKTETSPAAPARPVISDLESRISAAMGLRVRIVERRGKHRGRVIVDYHTLDDFERIVARLGLADE